MVRNFGKGGKGCKKMKNCVLDTNRILLFKDQGQEYAVVEDIYGHGRYNCHCQDSVTRMSILRGSLRSGAKRITKGDTVLVSLREYQDYKADIIHVYNADEVRALCNYGELTQTKIDDELEFAI